MPLIHKLFANLAENLSYMKKFLILISLFVVSFAVTTTYAKIYTANSIVKSQQTERVCFTVVDEFGYPIIGATIVVLDKNNNIKGGYTTDISGNVCIDVSIGDTIKISMIGYQEITIIYIGQHLNTQTLKEF